MITVSAITLNRNSFEAYSNVSESIITLFFVEYVNNIKCIVKIINKVIVLNTIDSGPGQALAPVISPSVLKCSATYSIGGISVDSHNVDIQVRFWPVLDLAD